jgi:N-acetylmuramoyl-L-alanine amidase
MFGAGQRHRETGRSILAWLGLLLMAASFIWLQLLPRTATFPPITQKGANEEPFAVVVIDPGHGGLDSGTMKAGMREKDLTLDVARRAERLLESRGLVTLLTRTDDSYVSLTARATLANEQPNCIFISIHFDEAGRSGATGIETYYAARQVSIPDRVTSWLPFLQRTSLESINAESQSLASFIQEELVLHTQALNRGTRPQQFFVIANVRHPAVLVEGGFLTNKDDASKLATEIYREQIAAAISDGVVRYRDVLQQQCTPLVVNLPGE